MLSLDADCPCGSGLQVKSCCIPTEPPLVRRREGFSRVNIEAQLVLTTGLRFPLPRNMEVEAVLRRPQQVDPRIEEVMQAIKEPLGWLSGQSIHPDLRRLTNNLEHALYAVRYHQRQFLYRLRMLTLDHMFVHKHPEGNVTVYFGDIPLQVELEAFLMRTRAALDALSHLACSVLGKRSRGIGGLFKDVDKFRGSLEPGQRAALKSILWSHENWIKECKTLRDAITHDGEVPGFDGVGYREARLIDPVLQGVAADHLCFRVWKSLLEITGQVFETVLRPR